MKISMQQIYTFFSILDAGTIGAAAEKMYISPQALNKQIRIIEDALGEKIIERKAGKRDIHLTDAGKMLLECYKESYDKFLDGNVRFANYLAVKKNIIKVGFYHKVNENQVLMPFLDKLKENSEIKNIQLCSGDLGEVLEWVIDGTCDVCITNLHEMEKHKNGIEYIPILKCPACIYVSKQHPWAEKEEITVKDMEQATMLVIPWNERLERECFWRKAKVKEKKIVTDTNSMLTMVKTGEYFAVVPDFPGDDDERLVKKALPKEYQFEAECSMVFRKENVWANSLKNL